MKHGTIGCYTNQRCRCPECTSARREYDQKRKASHVVPGHRRPTNAPVCLACDRPIQGIPDGWKHVADNRQFGDDGHEAEPRTIA